MGGGLLDYTVSFLGQVIVIVISRPRSLTIFFSLIFTHDKEELCDGQELSLEQFIDGALGQAPHLPPVREQRETGQHKADNVDQEEEDDEQIEIQELWSVLE